MSADSTSNRGVNFQSCHIAMRAPTYKPGNPSVDNSTTPKSRLLCLESTVDHSASTSVESILKHVEDCLDVFNRSPAAARLKKTMNIRNFMRVLKGMNGDHASAEKSAARGLKEKKHNAALEDLGEESLLSMTVGELVAYLSAWNQKKVAEVGGIDDWNKLCKDEQVKRDKSMMKEIVQTLGKEEYDLLSPMDRRDLDLFIWAGCCMHKDQNSFRCGAAEMMLAWQALGVQPPILLANKSNAATL